MNIIKPHKIQELIQDGFQTDIGAYFSEATDLVKKELGLFAGFSVVYFIIFGASAIVPMASIIVGPPLVAGFYYSTHKVYKHEVLKFEDFFRGFDLFAPLVVQQLIAGLLMAAVIIPAMLIMVVATVSLTSNGGDPLLSLLILASGLAAIAGILYLSVSYMFAPLFILFGKMEAWESMEASRKIIGRNFFSMLWLVLLLALLNFLGALICFIGLIFTLPLSYAVIYVAFKDILDIDTPIQDGGEGDIYNHLVN